MEQTFGEESRFIRATKDNILLKRLGTLRRKKVLLQNRNLNEINELLKESWHSSPTVNQTSMTKNTTEIHGRLVVTMTRETFSLKKINKEISMNKVPYMMACKTYRHIRYPPRLQQRV